MELLSDEAQVESRFSPCGDNVNVGVRLVHGSWQTYHRLINHFGRTRWYSKVTMLKWKLILVHLKTANLDTR
jgi:hypothetical protein